MIIKQRNYINILVEWIIAIVVICNSGYVLMMTQEAKPIFLLALVSMIMFIIWLKNNKDNFLRSYYFLSFIILSIFCMITYIVNMELGSIMLYFNILCIIILSFCISWYVDFDKFVLIYIKIMKYVTIISLFFYILSNYFGITFHFPIISTANATYYNGVVYFQFIYSSLRNTGIFWEPGLYASFIIIALVFQICFASKKHKIINIIIFFLGLLSTYSTAAYLFIPFIIVLIFADNAHTKSQFLLLIFIILLGIVINIYSEDIILFLVKINPIIFVKLISETSSSNTRINGPLLNLKIFLLRPIFGVGFSNATRLFLQQNYLYHVDSQTSTSTFFIAAMGIPGVLYTYNWIHGIFGIKYKNLITRLTIFIIFIGILNKEPHTGLAITYCIMFCFLKEADQCHNAICRLR